MKKQTLLYVIALMLFGFAANAQVKFKLSYNQADGRYTVSVLPMASYSNPQNITGTGQVTIKVPTNRFDPVDIVSHLNGMYWEANSRNNAPEEAPDNDYISFGLIIQGVAYPDYVQDAELPMFSFQNAYGCTGEVVLVNNTTDPFMPPNSESSNIGNTLTILGAGGDAYFGIAGNGIIDCAGNLTPTTEVVSVDEFAVYPNPASDFVNVEIKWSGDATDARLMVIDPLGRKVTQQAVSIVNGANKEKLNVSGLAAGSYLLYLQNADWKISLDKITKQ